MTANSLSDALHEAYVQARDMDASLASAYRLSPTRCDALARISRRPSTSLWRG